MRKWTEKEKQRFWSKVDRQADVEACWDWKAGCFPPQGKETVGYGAFYWNGRNHAAHRIAYALWYDVPLEELEVVGHQVCDRPPCCNPAHLKRGTQEDNLAHMREADRSLYGERNPKARLTDEVVRPLAQRYAQGNVSAQKLADELGVSKTTVLRALRGHTWERVDAEDVSQVLEVRKYGESKRRRWEPRIANCEVCGKEMVCLVPIKRYCSAVCQRKAYYSRE